MLVLTTKVSSLKRSMLVACLNWNSAPKETPNQSVVACKQRLYSLSLNQLKPTPNHVSFIFQVTKQTNMVSVARVVREEWRCRGV